MTLVGEALLREATMVEEFTTQCVDQQSSVYPISDELLSPLLQWPHLTKLHLHGPISPDAYAIVRQLAHLTFLEMSTNSNFDQWLTSAEDGPVPPRLEEILLWSTWT